MQNISRLEFLSLVLPLFSFFISGHIDLSSSQALKSFGESCDNDCDERQLLTCSITTSICECMQPKSMIFSEDHQKCVGMAGFPCVRYAADLHCLPHASCNKTTKTCHCDKGYFGAESGTTCSILAKFGESCSGKRPCDRTLGMVCTDKTGSGGRAKRTCQCQYASDQYYDKSQEACISYAGGNCSFSWPCVPNAACSEDIYELRQGENVHGKQYSYNVTIGRKCSCQEGTHQTTSRQCLPSYGHSCSINSSCNPEENLKCFDSSICLCSNPLSMTYETATKKCVHLVGAKCSTTDNTAPCIVNAECSVSGKCQCKPGFSSCFESTCLKDFGTECNKTGECNVYRGLSCHEDMRCGCISPTLQYDTNSRTCHGMEGGPCGIFTYSQKIGFLLATNLATLEQHGLSMTGNHKEIMARNGNAATPSNHHNGAPSSSPSFGVTAEKVYHVASSFPKTSLPPVKIQVKCATDLECVNEFGQVMQRNEHLFQGFCRRNL